MITLIIAIVLASFWVDGFVWLYLYYNLCKNIGFKNAIITSFQVQIDIVKDFILFLFGYNKDLNKIVEFSIDIEEFSTDIEEEIIEDDKDENK